MHDPRSDNGDHPSSDSASRVLVRPYTPADASAWDSFIDRSKNGTFLFKRGYMEYHQDRHPDSSLLLTVGGRLTAVFPASRQGHEVISHGGLTFGGVVSDDHMSMVTMLAVFDGILSHLQSAGVHRLIYKAIPHFYHRYPSCEDLYVLQQKGARLFRRDAGSILCPADRPPLQERKRRSVRKASAAGLVIRETDDYPAYWRLLEENLRKRYGLTPVHTLAEIELLRSRFPANIRLFGTFQGERMLAGTTIFENPTVAHAQYIASSDEGRELGALDLLFTSLIEGLFAAKRWFSFGISTEANGSVLNHGLIASKEGFGARTCVHDFYELDLQVSHVPR